jgi:hypothetical protein
MALTASNATLYVNGLTWNIQAELEQFLGGFARSKITNSMSQTHFSEKPTGPSVNVTLIYTAAENPLALNDLQGATVLIVFNIGHEYQITNAFRDGDPLSVNTAEGTIPITLSGDTIRRIK